MVLEDLLDRASKEALPEDLERLVATSSSARVRRNWARFTPRADLAKERLAVEDDRHVLVILAHGTDLEGSHVLAQRGMPALALVALTDPSLTDAQCCALVEVLRKDRRHLKSVLTGVGDPVREWHLSERPFTAAMLLECAPGAAIARYAGLESQDVRCMLQRRIDSLAPGAQSTLDVLLGITKEVEPGSGIRVNRHMSTLGEGRRSPRIRKGKVTFDPSKVLAWWSHPHSYGSVDLSDPALADLVGYWSTRPGGGRWVALYQREENPGADLVGGVLLDDGLVADLTRGERGELLPQLRAQSVLPLEEAREVLVRCLGALTLTMTRQVARSVATVTELVLERVGDPTALVLDPDLEALWISPERARAAAATVDLAHCGQLAAVAVLGRADPARVLRALVDLGPGSLEVFNVMGRDFAGTWDELLAVIRSARV